MKKGISFVCLLLSLLLLPAPLARGAGADFATPAEFDGYIIKVSDLAPLGRSALSGNVDSLGDGLYRVDSISDALQITAPSNIEYIEPDYTLELMTGTVTDDYTPSQWHLQAINASAAWELDLTGNDVKVAVIDSGLRVSHEDLDGSRVLPVVDFTNDGQTVGDARGHGTQVSGVLAARVNNQQSQGTPVVDGVAPDVNLLPLRVFSNTKTATVSMAISAINYAVEQNCGVINMSFGTISHSQSLQAACEAAAERGILLVAAAGNTGSSNYYYPAAYDCVVSVAAVTQGTDGGDDYIRADFSQYNNRVFVTAPGANISTISFSGDTAYVTNANGTSFSAPIVSGMAALAKEKSPYITSDTFRQLLIRSSRDLGDAGRDPYYGYGMVDIGAFVAELSRDYTIRFENVDDTQSLTYRLDMTEPLAIPALADNSEQLFGGWYDNEKLEGTPITSIQPGTARDMTLYPRWISLSDLMVDSVTVAGYEADPDDGGTSFSVTIPKGIEVTSGNIVVKAHSPGWSVVSKAVYSDDVWNFSVSVGADSRNYTLTVTVSDYAVPLVDQSALPQGYAAPASLDGKTVAVPFTQTMAFAFSEPDNLPLTYELTGHNGASHPTFSTTTGEFSYTPVQEDGGKTLTFSFRAFNDHFYSDTLTLTIAVGTRPPSDALVLTKAFTTDRYDAADIELEMTLYDNSLSSLSLNGGPLQAGTDYRLLSAPVDGKDAVVLSASLLGRLEAGTHTVLLSFATGQNVSVTLNHADSAPRYTVTFFTDADGATQYHRLENLRSGSTISLPATPKKDQYTFDGWFTNTEGTLLQFSTATQVVSDLSLYARWSPAGGGDIGGGSTIGGGGGGTPPVSHSITATASVGGKVSEEEITVNAGDSASITVMPDKGYVISSILVDNNPIPLPQNPALPYEHVFSKVVQSHTIAAFFVPADQVLLPLSPYPGFTDIKETDWHYEAVRYLYERTLFQGVSNSEFAPDRTMNRAMLVTVLYRLASLAPDLYALPMGHTSQFSDVPTHSWFSDAVGWAGGAKIVGGLGNGLFSPEGILTREQMAVILMNFARAAGMEVSAPPDEITAFSDSTAISPWAREGVNWAISTGLIQGKDSGQLAPGDAVTRAQAATMLMRFMELNSILSAQ